MTTQTLPLATAMLRFAASRRRSIAVLCLVRFAWAALAVFLALVYFDVLLQLNSATRVVLLSASAFGVLAACALAYNRHTRARSESRLVARLIEQDEPELHNDLINALEFEELLARNVETPLSRPLMGEEIALATQKTARVQRVAALKPPSLRKEVKVLCIEAAATAVLVAVFYQVFAAVVPRYLDPFGDHPPYSATQLVMDPAGVTVDYDDKVTLRAIASGRKPEEVTLVLEDARGAIVAELPMLRATEGDYRQAIEHAKDDLTYYARIDRGRSKRYPLSISKIPRIGAASVAYHYPAYTRLTDKTRQIGDNGVIKAYEGTEVALTIASNRPLRGGALRVNDADAPFVADSGAQAATGRFSIDRDGALEARLVDVDGNQSKDALRAKIEVQPDTKPKVDVLSPGRQAFAIPSAQIPIEIEAQDDLGVASITIVRAINESGDLSKTLYTSDGAEPQAHAVELMDLADLGVRPGDSIDFYVTATDNFPKSPHTTATPSFRINIISEEDYRDFLQKETSATEMKEQYDQLNTQLDALSRVQEALHAATDALRNAEKSGVAPSDEDRKKIADLAQQQAALAEQAAETAKAMREKAASPDTFDIEKEFKKSLEKMAERLDRANELMKKGGEQLAKASSGDAAEQQAALEEAANAQQEALEELGQSKQEFAKGVEEPAKDLERMYRLLEDVETFKSLFQAQEELERQARSFQEVKDPSLDQQVRMKELSQAQSEIRDGLIDLRNAIDKHAAEIEPDLPQVARDARGIIDGIDGANIPTVMERAAGGLSAGDGAKGHAGTKEALDALDVMIDRVKQAEGSSSESETRLRVTMGMEPGNTMSQMRKGMQGAFNRSKPGQRGESSGGSNSSDSKFDMYGPQGRNGKPDESSVMSKQKADAAMNAGGEESRLAGSFEELGIPKSGTTEIDAGASEPIAQEYRNLIDAYFERVAEEKP